MEFERVPGVIERLQLQPSYALLPYQAVYLYKIIVINVMKGNYKKVGKN